MAFLFRMLEQVDFNPETDDFEKSPEDQ